MHVLVTGCTGFVGFHTVLALHRGGHSVRLGVRNVEKMRRVFSGFDIPLDDFAIGEIVDADAVAASLNGVNAVVHCAALVSLEAKDDKLMMDTNLGGTRNVLGQAVERGIDRLVYVSSSSAMFNPQLDRMTEASPLTVAKNGYGQSKRAADEYVRELIQGGANIAISYPTGVLGPDDPGLSENNGALAYFLNEMMVDTNGTTQNVDVRDLATVHLKMLEQGLGGRYLVGGTRVRWREYIDVIESVTGQKGRVMKIPAPALKLTGAVMDVVKKFIDVETLITSEAMEYALHYPLVDDTRLKEHLGADLYRPLADTVGDTIDWLAKAGHVENKWRREG